MLLLLLLLLYYYLLTFLLTAIEFLLRGSSHYTSTDKINNKYMYTMYLQMNDAVSKVNKKFTSHLTRAQRTPSAAAAVQVSHALPAVRFSCLLRGRGVSLQDDVAAGKGFLCAPF